MRASGADEAPQTHLLCSHSHAFYETLSQNNVLKSLGKKKKLIVLGAPAHNYDPADLTDPRSDAGGKRSGRASRSAQLELPEEEPHKNTLKINLGRQRPGVNQV